MGGYVDAEGVRYTVGWCVGMVTHDGSTPTDHGYERHESVQTACDAWGLTPYVDPEAEAEFEEISYSQGQENDENDLTTTD